MIAKAVKTKLNSLKTSATEQTSHDDALPGLMTYQSLALSTWHVTLAQRSVLARDVEPFIEVKAKLNAELEQ